MNDFSTNWILSIRNDEADVTRLYIIRGTKASARRQLWDCILSDRDSDDSFEKGTKSPDDLSTDDAEDVLEGWNQFTENAIHYTMMPLYRIPYYLTTTEQAYLASIEKAHG